MPAEAGLAERTQDEGDHLRVSGRPGDADQLDPALEELARLAATPLDGAVGVGEVAEPQGRRHARVAVGHEPRDRDGRVRAEREHVAAVVEEPEAGTGRALVAAA